MQPMQLVLAEEWAQRFPIPEQPAQEHKEYVR